MLHIKDIAVKNTSELLEKAVDAAHSFGFSSLDELLDVLPSKRLKAANKVVHAQPRERNLLPTMRKLATKNIHKTPDHILGYSVGKSTESKDSFTLNIAGTENPIAEATLIATAYTLLQSVGVKDATVHVNSLGTAESFTRYMRDLTKYFKKISKDTPLQITADLAVSPLRAYARLCNTNEELARSCPNAIDYLNDDGRSHLWGLLEYLESAQIPYILDNTVTGSGDFFEQTLFEIKSKDRGELLAYGGRHGILARRAFKKNIPNTSLTIDINGHGARTLKKISTPKPRLYFAQLGTSAKKLGIKVLNMLHHANIKVAHSLTQEELVKQMSYLPAKEAAHIIIIGQKEALEDSVIVRNTSTHKQQTVPTDKLVKYLKKLQG
jgi:histidyl-tRNA synthetase